MRVPICMQIQPGENGLAAFQSILGANKRYASTEELRTYCRESRNGISPQALVDLGKHYNLDGEIKELAFKDLKNVKLPCIICWKKKYYCVIIKMTKKYVHIMDPFKGDVTLTLEKLEKEYNGKTIEFIPNKDFKKGGKKETTFSILKNRLWPYKASLLGFLVLDLVIAAIGFFFIQFTTKMLDDVIGGRQDKLYLPLLLTLIGLCVGKFIFNVVKVIKNFRISKKMSANSTSTLFERLLRMPASFYEQHALGELDERLLNNSKVDIELMQTLIPSIMQTGISIVYLILMFTYSVYVALAVVVLEVVHFLITTILQKRLAVLLRSQASSSGAANSSAFNMFNNIDTIKSMGTERFYFNLWNGARTDYRNDQQRIRNLEFVINSLTAFHDILIATVFLFFGAFLIDKGQFSLGMLYSSKSAYKYISTGIKTTINADKKIQESKTYIERAEDIKRREEDKTVPLNNEEPDKLLGNLQIKNLSYRYHKDDPVVLKNINIEIKPGEMVALVGSSGCGKTTLCKIVSGIYKQSDGEVLYDGKHREEIPDVIFHSSVSTVDQETCVFNDTIANNLKMNDDTVTDFEMILAANDAQIHNRIIQENKGYDSLLENGGGNFSGGEVQRLELARALSQEPTLLILDEFTSALDALTEEKIFNAVKEKGTSALIIAHRLSTIVNCDRIYVMDHGEIIEQGTHDELYALNGYYHELVSKQ